MSLPSPHRPVDGWPGPMHTMTCGCHIEPQHCKQTIVFFPLQRASPRFPNPTPPFHAICPFRAKIPGDVVSRSTYHISPGHVRSTSARHQLHDLPNARSLHSQTSSSSLYLTHSHIRQWRNTATDRTRNTALGMRKTSNSTRRHFRTSQYLAIPHRFRQTTAHRRVKRIPHSMARGSLHRV